MVEDYTPFSNNVVGDGCGVPSVAVQWIVDNAFTNVELAILSNVCRGWREMAAQCIVDAASLEMTKEKYSVSPTFSSLLLPSIVRHFYSVRTDLRARPSKSELEQEEEKRQRDETYCVAWFHPDGIKFEQLSIVKPSPESCEEDEQPNPGGTPKSQAEAMDPSSSNHKHLFTKSNLRLNQSLAASTRPESCPASDNIMDWGCSVLYQWDGYSEAIDVLSPFGYTRCFLRRILEKTQEKSFSERPTGVKGDKRGLDVDQADILPSSSPWAFPTRCDSTYSSCAVRGATYARPEGYCQCWDNDSFDPSHSKDEAWTRKRNNRRKELQREVLPKVLWSKHDDKDMGGCGGIYRPCIQFLNIDSTNAVRLFTPKFKTPVFTPLTIFCVAIATEDGCFFSGLEQRFEMGHMHPTKGNIEINDERSPICLNASYTNCKVCRLKDNLQGMDSTKKYQEMDVGRTDAIFLDPSCKCFRPSTNVSEEESEEESEEFDDDSFADFLLSANQEGDESMNDCDDDDDDDDDDDSDCEHIVRGRLGPGMWHCYVGVFDGIKSIIRIDGEEEPTSGASAIPPSFQACLDGITIGSDHVFDMTLCFGEGSDGEGEGAMSELVLFKGRLQDADIKSLESHLMKKHGIPVPFRPRNERVNDDYYSRLAHTLMDQSPSTYVNRKRGGGVEGKSVPLRYMTELRHVAWKQKDNVTGRPRSIRRIGASHRKGSISEW